MRPGHIASHRLNKGLKAVALWLLRFYKRRISPLLPPSCRFVPTCSEYAIGSIEAFGVWKGTYLATRRLLRCHPLHPGGFDPVPTQEQPGH